MSPGSILIGRAGHPPLAPPWIISTRKHTHQEAAAAAFTHPPGDLQCPRLSQEHCMGKFYHLCKKNWCRLKKGSVPGCSSAHTELAARAGLQLPLPGGSILTATNTIPYMPAQMAAVIHQGRPGRWCKFYSLNRSALTVCLVLQKCSQASGSKIWRAG